MTMQTEISPGAAVAVVPADDGWAWVVKLTSILVLGKGLLELGLMLQVLWSVWGTILLPWGLSSVDSTSLLLKGWVAVSLGATVCMILAGWSGLVRSTRTKRFMFLAAALYLIQSFSLQVYSFMQLREALGKISTDVLVGQSVRMVLNYLGELWLPVLLVAVATRPAIKLLLDEPRARGAFEPLPVAPAAQPESSTAP
jgi:hypothetical protein